MLIDDPIAGLVERRLYEAGQAAGYLAKAAGDATSVYALRGRLTLSSSGWGMLEIPNPLIRGLFSALDVPGAELPLRDGKLRGHVSVFRPEELEQLGGANRVTEWGKRFAYQIGPVQEVAPAGWGGVSKAWFCQIFSPELKALRKSYGLTPLPHNNEYDFHATFATRKTGVLGPNDVSKTKAAGAIAHIGGVGGAGKTTLLEQIGASRPDIATKDLDELDEAAKVDLGLDIYHKDWSDDDFAKHHGAFQGQLDNYLASQGDRPVVLGGFHMTGKDRSLDVPVDRRVMLDTGPLKGTYRSYRRARRMGEPMPLSSLPSHYMQSRRDHAEWKSLGYEPMSGEAIQSLVEQLAPTKAAASAVVVKGNPKFIAGNPDADKFYEAIRGHLASRGHDVSFDPGEAYTSPPPADLWVGHSRGASRLMFAPPGTKTLAFGSSHPGAVNHPDDTEMRPGYKPTNAHYVLTPEMAAALDAIMAGPVTDNRPGVKDAAARHVLVTGPSGAGKSTLAAQLAEERGLPLRKLDDVPAWKELFRADPENRHLVPGTPEHGDYQALRRRLVDQALRRPSPSVIEGTPLLTLGARRAANHEVHLLAPPRDVVVDRRWNRLSNKPQNAHRVDDPDWRAAKDLVANKLYDEAEPDIARLRAIPGVNVKESAVDHVLKAAGIESVAIGAGLGGAGNYLLDRVIHGEKDRDAGRAITHGALLGALAGRVYEHGNQANAHEHHSPRTGRFETGPGLGSSSVTKPSVGEASLEDAVGHYYKNAPGGFVAARDRAITNRAPIAGLPDLKFNEADTATPVALSREPLSDINLGVTRTPANKQHIPVGMPRIALADRATPNQAVAVLEHELTHAGLDAVPAFRTGNPVFPGPSSEMTADYLDSPSEMLPRVADIKRQYVVANPGKSVNTPAEAEEALKWHHARMRAPSSFSSSSDMLHRHGWGDWEWRYKHDPKFWDKIKQLMIQVVQNDDVGTRDKIAAEHKCFRATCACGATVAECSCKGDDKPTFATKRVCPACREKAAAGRDLLSDLAGGAQTIANWVPPADSPFKDMEGFAHGFRTPTWADVAKNIGAPAVAGAAVGAGLGHLGGVPRAAGRMGVIGGGAGIGYGLGGAAGDVAARAFKDPLHAALAASAGRVGGLLAGGLGARALVGSPAKAEEGDEEVVPALKAASALGDAGTALGNAATTAYSHLPRIRTLDSVAGAAVGGLGGLAVDSLRNSDDLSPTRRRLRRLGSVATGALAGAGLGNLVGDRTRRYVSNTMLPSYGAGNSAKQLVPKSWAQFRDAAILDKPVYGEQLDKQFGPSSPVGRDQPFLAATHRDFITPSRRELGRRGLGVHTPNPATDWYASNPDGTLSLNPRHPRAAETVQRFFGEPGINIPGALFYDPVKFLADKSRDANYAGKGSLMSAAFAGGQEIPHAVSPDGTVHGRILDRWDVTLDPLEHDYLYGNALRMLSPSWRQGKLPTRLSGSVNPGTMGSNRDAMAMLAQRELMDKVLEYEHPWVRQDFDLARRPGRVDRTLQVRNADGTPFGPPITNEGNRAWVAAHQKKGASRDLGDHTQLPLDLVTFIRQRHERHGREHEDIRVGTPQLGLYSWASPKGLPAVGQKKPTALYQTPVHSFSYGGFQGRLRGGDAVSVAERGRAHVTGHGPAKLDFTLVDRDPSERMRFFRPPGMAENTWLARNLTTVPVPVPVGVGG